MSEKFCHEVAGIVLAGGKSSRMGTDKALLNWQGCSLLQSKVKQLQGLLGDAVYVSGDYPNFRCIKDQQVSLGPLSGIASCLSVIPAKFCLFIAVDMPCLPNQVLLKLLKLAQHSQQSCYCRDSIFPLLIQVNQQNQQGLAALLMSADRKQLSIRTFMSAIKARVLELSSDEQALMLNTNTPEQWQALQTENHHEPLG